MGEDNRIKEQWQLLQSLRSTVEGLLIYGVSNVWNIYGGLNRLHSVVEQIFKHGCRIFDPLGEPDCSVFIQGLNWLQPSLALSTSVVESDEYLANLPARIASRKDILWIYKSLENHSLSQKLSWLLSDKEHLLSCLEPWAFLCQESLAEATLICLQAVERNQAALLTEIDPCLFLPGGGFSKNSPKRHRRSSSYPINFGNTRIETTVSSTEMSVNDRVENMEKNRKISENVERSSVDDLDATRSMNAVPGTISDERENEISLKSWNSLPVLCKDHEICQKSCALPLQAFLASNRPDEDVNVRTTGRTIELSEVIKIDYSEGIKVSDPMNDSSYRCKPKKSKAPTRKRRNKTKTGEKSESRNSNGSSETLNYEETPSSTVIECIARTGQHLASQMENSSRIDIEPQKTRKKSIFSPGSALEFTGSWSLGVEGLKDIRTHKKSFMEDGGSSVQPMATGYFPRPLEGQSLTSFLSSAQFSRANAELDRENAHFSISEAMIAAIEQVKCNRQLRLIDEAALESDEEINNLKHRIRLRRLQKQMEQKKIVNWNRELLSDGKTDTTTTTDQSISPLSSSPGSPSDILSTEEMDDLEIYRSRKYPIRQDSDTDDDLFESSSQQGTESAITESVISAEGVALCLISRFSERHLPRASELQWLVSEQDAPQKLLPLPKNWSGSPFEEARKNDEEDQSSVVPLRGTIEWAPPRPQIIFTPHPSPVRRILIAKQNYRCAGCGMKVAVEYANRFRYCEYLGRYFCTGCHTNQVALIPGKILSKWDFSRYPVSNFSYRLLDQMAVDPLFQINDLNALLYRRVKALERTRYYRTQLYFLKDFLLTCRFGQIIQQALKKQPNYIFNDPHVYSIQDLMSVKVGVLTQKLGQLVEQCCAHVAECELCEARGFVCELCASNSGSVGVIFPWELSKVTRCNKCCSCYHITCKKKTKNPNECRRCARLQERRSVRDTETH